MGRDGSGCQLELWPRVVEISRPRQPESQVFVSQYILDEDLLLRSLVSLSWNWGCPRCGDVSNLCRSESKIRCGWCGAQWASELPKKVPQSENSPGIRRPFGTNILVDC